MIARTLVTVVRSLARGGPRRQVAADRLTTELLRWRLAPCFAAGRESVPVLAHLLAAGSLPVLPRVDATWREVWVGVDGPGHRLGLRQAWPDPGHGPVVIFHHGAGERDAERGLRILALGRPPPVAAIALRAAGHHSHRALVRQLRSGSGAILLLAASVLLVEALVQRLAPRPVVVVGSSLGGMVALLHAAWRGRQGGRHRLPRWISYAAGCDAVHLLARGNFARLRPERDPFAIEQALAGAWHGLARVADRVHPVLGAYDQLHCLRPQRAALRSHGVEPLIVARSHLGLALAGPHLRAHLDRVLARA